MVCVVLESESGCVCRLRAIVQVNCGVRRRAAIHLAIGQVASTNKALGPNLAGEQRN